VDDADALWAELYRTEWPRLIRYLMKCFPAISIDDAADATQCAFIELFRNWKKVHNPRAWLWTVAYRHVLHSPARKEVQFDSLHQEPAAAPASMRLEFLEETQAVLAALWQLPKAQRQVFALMYDQFSYCEIAAMMKTNEVAVRKNAERARRAMRELFGDTL
jgi:RNA polymerase sigma factor (sigma-70 family)